jgi:hypothetical protein
MAAALSHASVFVACVFFLIVQLPLVASAGDQKADGEAWWFLPINTRAFLFRVTVSTDSTSPSPCRCSPDTTRVEEQVQCYRGRGRGFENLGRGSAMWPEELVGYPVPGTGQNEPGGWHVSANTMSRCAACCMPCHLLCCRKLCDFCRASCCCAAAAKRHVIKWCLPVAETWTSAPSAAPWTRS